MLPSHLWASQDHKGLTRQSLSLNRSIPWPHTKWGRLLIWQLNSPARLASLDLVPQPNKFSFAANPWSCSSNSITHSCRDQRVPHPPVTIKSVSNNPFFSFCMAQHGVQNSLPPPRPWVWLTNYCQAHLSKVRHHTFIHLILWWKKGEFINKVNKRWSKHWFLAFTYFRSTFGGRKAHQQLIIYD